MAAGAQRRDVPIETQGLGESYREIGKAPKMGLARSFALGTRQRRGDLLARATGFENAKLRQGPRRLHVKAPGRQLPQASLKSTCGKLADHEENDDSHPRTLLLEHDWTFRRGYSNAVHGRRTEFDWYVAGTIHATGSDLDSRAAGGWQEIDRRSEFVCFLVTGSRFSDTRVEGNTVAFKCKSGRTMIAFEGTLDAEQIAFTWDLQRPPYGWSMRFREDLPPPAQTTARLFGPSAPRNCSPDAFQMLMVIGRDGSTRPMGRGEVPAVTFERILHPEREPQNWLTYSGSVGGERYTPLTQITPVNVDKLELAWAWQAQSQEKFEATPLVVDGILYTVEPPNTVVALDAATGSLLWKCAYTPPPTTFVCCGGVNRGLAILDDTLFLGTLDAHLLAINARTGKPIWDTTVADARSFLQRYLLLHHSCPACCEGQSHRRHRGRRHRPDMEFVALSLRHT